MFDKAGKESQYMISHPELGLDMPIGSDRESGRDRESRSQQEVILGPREECCDKRQDIEIEKKLERQLLSR